MNQRPGYREKPLGHAPPHFCLGLSLEYHIFIFLSVKFPLVLLKRSKRMPKPAATQWNGEAEVCLPTLLPITQNTVWGGGVSRDSATIEPFFHAIIRAR